MRTYSFKAHFKREATIIEAIFVLLSVVLVALALVAPVVLQG